MQRIKAVVEGRKAPLMVGVFQVLTAKTTALYFHIKRILPSHVFLISQTQALTIKEQQLAMLAQITRVLFQSLLQKLLVIINLFVLTGFFSSRILFL